MDMGVRVIGELTKQQTIEDLESQQQQQESGGNEEIDPVDYLKNFHLRAESLFRSCGCRNNNPCECD